MGMRRSRASTPTQNILEGRNQQRDASLFESGALIQQDSDFIEIDFDDPQYQSELKPFLYPMQIKSMIVKNVDTSNRDGQAFIYTSFNRPANQGLWVPRFTNESVENVDGLWDRLYLWVPNIPGRKLGLEISTTGAIRSGNSTVTGTVELAQATAGPSSVVTIPATTPTLLAGDEPLRKEMEVFNQTGNIIYISDNNTVSPTTGWPIFNNQSRPIPWSGPVWAYGLAAGDVPLMRAY